MTGLATVATAHPELWARLSELVDACYAAGHVPPRTLELCRLRIAQLLGSEREQAHRRAEAPVEDRELTALRHWSQQEEFTAGERACLALAEQYVLDVHGIDDTTAARVVDVVGDDGYAALTVALGMFEGVVRLSALLDDPVRTAPMVEARFAERAGGRG